LSSFCFFTHTPPVRPTGDTERARVCCEPVVSMASTGDVTAALALALAARGGLEKDDLDGEGLEGEA
jgi:hypothetical protein